MDNTSRSAGYGDEKLTPEQAFQLLGNETRLAILFALWDAYDPDRSVTVLSFSELYQRVDYDDPGNFNYHLDKLLGHFVTKTDDGYALRHTGLKFVRSVIAGTGVGRLDPVEVDSTCPLCDASKVVAYEDELLSISCSECDGHWGPGGGYPRGTLMTKKLPPVCLVERTPDELLHVAEVLSRHLFQLAIEGTCPECTGPMSTSLTICEEHEHGGLCEHCGRQFWAVYQFRCGVCKCHRLW